MPVETPYPLPSHLVDELEELMQSIPDRAETVFRLRRFAGLIYANGHADGRRAQARESYYDQESVTEPTKSSHAVAPVRGVQAGDLDGPEAVIADPTDGLDVIEEQLISELHALPKRTAKMLVRAKLAGLSELRSEAIDWLIPEPANGHDKGFNEGLTKVTDAIAGVLADAEAAGAPLP